MVIKGFQFELLWVEVDELGGKSAEWAYHNKLYYHIHTGQRPSQVKKDNRCNRCRKEIPGLVALAFKLHGG
jgi:hypothetical protein